MKGCVLTSLIHMHCSPFPTQLGEETIFFLLYIFISMVARLLSLVTNPHPEVVWGPQESLITINPGVVRRAHYVQHRHAYQSGLSRGFRSSLPRTYDKDRVYRLLFFYCSTVPLTLILCIYWNILVL